MGAEAITSGAIGAVGSVAVAAPIGGVAMGPGIGAEIGGGISKGVGFDNGTPTFSGLGRSDVNIPSFNQSLFNPGETRSFSPSSMSAPEGPVKGNFFKDTTIIASNPSIKSEPIPSINRISIFDNAQAFKATEPIKENTFIIAKASEPDSISVVDQPKITFESVLESHIRDSAELNLGDETATDVMEDIMLSDPLTAAQLESDLASVDVIAEIASEVTDKETAAEIVNSAIDTAIYRAGIIEKIDEKIASETEVKSKTVDTKADQETKTGKLEPISEIQTEEEINTETETATENRSPSSITDLNQDEEDTDSKDNDKENQTANRQQLVREETVDEARVNHMSRAIDQAYADKANKEKVAGTEITAQISGTPSPDEQSGYAKILGMSGDGTYTEFVNEMSGETFDVGNADQAKAEAKRLAEKHYAVTIANNGKPAEEKQAEEVKRGGVPKTGVIFSIK